MLETILMLILGIAMLFIIERYMCVLFEKRRTRLSVFLLSLLFAYVLVSAAFLLSGNPWVMTLATVILLENLL